MARKTLGKVATTLRMDRNNREWCEKEARREYRTISNIVNHVLRLHIAKEKFTDEISPNPSR